MTKLRSNITPGTVLILLAGRFKGKRVVFIRQLSSGLLLVSGPHRINGVPIKRVNQAYVIATSTKIDISSASIPEVDEKIFKKNKKSKKTGKDEMFDGQDNKKELSAERKKLQTTVDSELISAVKAVPNMRSYLKSLFTLQKGQAPHAMKF